jgi:4-alpha-glucanotransferase
VNIWFTKLSCTNGTPFLIKINTEVAMKRASGILLPVSSLPSKYGIGGFSKEAFRFIDLLEKSGQSCWQILPLGPTGYGDSPYQSFSTFAGNPYFISPETLTEEGLLTEEECEEADASDPEAPSYADYGRLYETRFVLLGKAFRRFEKKAVPEDYGDFLEENKGWLHDYALFMAIKSACGNHQWSLWPEELRCRKPEALKKFAEEHAEDIRFIYFQQYEFFAQWRRLKDYAHQHGVRIIGDIPIYVAMDSADTWSDPSLFQFDEHLTPLGVAGCPPDAFTADGQLWGNPLYDWERQKATGYRWWIGRMRHVMKMYDVVRIDHFRGFNDYWSVPFGDRTAAGGCWKKGPGLDLFRTAKKELGKMVFIAEDLGFLTDDVIRMVKKSGFPGMKIIEFAFDGSNTNSYLPFGYDHNCVVYTGTHDNDTAAGFLKVMDRKAKGYLNRYVGHRVRDVRDLIRLAMASTADTCIIPMQDWLGLGNEARINTPGTQSGNWRWRLLPGQFTEETAEEIREMTWVYGRIPAPAGK